MCGCRYRGHGYVVYGPYRSRHKMMSDQRLEIMDANGRFGPRTVGEWGYMSHGPCDVDLVGDIFDEPSLQNRIKHKLWNIKLSSLYSWRPLLKLSLPNLRDHQHEQNASENMDWKKMISLKIFESKTHPSNVDNGLDTENDCKNTKWEEYYEGH